MPSLVFTGGGTAGHVMPNLALAPPLQAQGWSLHYIGSTEGPERALAIGAGLSFSGIATGKLRRYFSWRNFTDPFRVLLGCWQAFAKLGELKPDLVFSKGGFVSVPVVLAAFVRRIPVLLHESDITPGLANRICLPFCQRICCSFPETLQHVSKAKGVLTGTPIRASLFQGNRKAGLQWLGFSEDKPVLMVMGGSMGAATINQVLRSAWPRLQPNYQIVHLCGSGKTDPAFSGLPGFRQFEFVGSELPDVLAATTCVLTRGGANALFELVALQKPCLIIPLPLGASRGDQILNAESFAQRGLGRVIRQESLTVDSLLTGISELVRDASLLKAAMEKAHLSQGTENVVAVIQNYLDSK